MLIWRVRSPRNTMQRIGDFFVYVAQVLTLLFLVILATVVGSSKMRNKFRAHASTTFVAASSTRASSVHARRFRSPAAHRPRQCQGPYMHVIHPHAPLLPSPWQRALVAKLDATHMPVIHSCDSKWDRGYSTRSLVG